MPNLKRISNYEADPLKRKIILVSRQDEND